MTGRDHPRGGIMIPIPQYPLYTATIAEYNAYGVSWTIAKRVIYLTWLNALAVPLGMQQQLSNRYLARASVLSNLVSIICCHTQFSAVLFDHVYSSFLLLTFFTLSVNMSIYDHLWISVTAHLQDVTKVAQSPLLNSLAECLSTVEMYVYICILDSVSPCKIPLILGKHAISNASNLLIEVAFIVHISLLLLCRWNVITLFFK